MPDLGTTITAVARINGVALHSPSEALAAEVLRQRACTELLRQAAQREGLLAADDSPCDRGRHQRSRDHGDRRAARARPARAGPVRRGVPPVSRGARRQIRGRRARACPAYPVRGHAGRRRCRPAQARGRRVARRALPRWCGRGWLRGRGARAVELSEWRGRRRPRLDRSEGLRAGIRARDLRQDRVGNLLRLVHSRFGLHVVEVRAREPWFRISRQYAARSRWPCASRAS